MKVDSIFKKYGYTMMEISKKTGINYHVLKHYRHRGISINLTIGIAYKLAQALEITIEELYSDIVKED